MRFLLAVLFILSSFQCYRLTLEKEEVINRYEQLLQDKSVYSLTLSAYTTSKDETDATPNITALNKKAIPGKTVAVSRDLLSLLGKKVYIEGYGVREVSDVMNSRYEGRMDLLLSSKNEARKFGVRECISVTVL